MEFKNKKTNKKRTEVIRRKALSRDIKTKLSIPPRTPDLDLPQSPEVQTAFEKYVYAMKRLPKGISAEIDDATWERLFHGKSDPMNEMKNKYNLIEKEICNKWLTRGVYTNRFALHLTALDLISEKDPRVVEKEAEQILRMIYDEWCLYEGKPAPHIASFSDNKIVPPSLEASELAEAYSIKAISEREASVVFGVDKPFIGEEQKRYRLNSYVSESCANQLATLTITAIVPFLFNYLLAHASRRTDIEDAIVMDWLTACFALQLISDQAQNRKLRAELPSPYKEIIAFAKKFFWDVEWPHNDARRFQFQPLFTEFLASLESINLSIEGLKNQRPEHDDLADLLPDLIGCRERYLSNFTTLGTTAEELFTMIDEVSPGGRQETILSDQQYSSVST